MGKQVGAGRMFINFFLLSSGVQDARKNYLIKPPNSKKIDAAGSTIKYGKKSGREYVHIPGPINQPLRFMVRVTIKAMYSLGKG